MARRRVRQDRRAAFPPGASDSAVDRIREIFADELRGHRVLTNNSKWLNFRTVRNERWHDGNVVLLGDAAHTAHFSIGSGTKLAMEDALALAACLHEHPSAARAGVVHLGSKALGGAGLVMTEMTCVSPEGRITPGCPGLWTDEQRDRWAAITGFVHQRSAAKIGLQLGHSGRKGSTRLMWEGLDEPLPDGNWEVIGPSALPYGAGCHVPREMTRADLDQVVADFAAAARRGVQAGFDLIEVHAAHGYLLSSFLSPVSNTRTDAYGGPLDNRLRFPLEVFDAVRDAVRAEAGTGWRHGAGGPDPATPSR